MGRKTFWKQVDSIRSSEIIIFAHGAEGDFIIAFAWVKQGMCVLLMPALLG